MRTMYMIMGITAIVLMVFSICAGLSYRLAHDITNVIEAGR